MKEQGNLQGEDGVKYKEMSGQPSELFACCLSSQVGLIYSIKVGISAGMLEP